MKRHLDVAVLALVACAPLVAQTPQAWRMGSVADEQRRF
jgi:hypothetical protein